MNTKQKKFESPLPAYLASSFLATGASHIYTSAIHARNFFYDRLPALSRGLGRPTISIGGIRAGGVGKTPVAQLIGRHVVDTLGFDVAFLSRGYGRANSKRSVIVKPHADCRFEDVGDEPCMLHRSIPSSWLGIGADRNAVAKRMLPALPDKTVFILDDGFQRRQTKRDLDIVCLSESVLDDRMLPAGYLREPVSSLFRTQVALVVGAQDSAGALEEVKHRLERKFANTVFAVLTQYPQSWVNGATGETHSAHCTPPFPKDAAAVSGIARPERFISMLRELSISPTEVRIFPDHHIFKKKDFLFDHDIYCNGKVKSVITTEKDFTRLRSGDLADMHALWYLKIGLRFADADSEACVLSIINNVLL